MNELMVKVAITVKMMSALTVDLNLNPRLNRIDVSPCKLFSFFLFDINLHSPAVGGNHHDPHKTAKTPKI
jgi:hypothetical protein